MNRGSTARALLALLTGGVLAAGVLPAGAAEAAALPDLQVSVVVTPEQASYPVGTTVTPTYTITNAGDAAATNIRNSAGRDTGLDRASEDFPAAPFDLAPGESRTIEWPAKVHSSAGVQGYANSYREFSNDAGEANPADNAAEYRIAVPGVPGAIRIKVFVDAKGDHDSAQPALPGAEVVVKGETDGRTAGTGTTDATGWYSLTRVPIGQNYLASVTGWVMTGGETETRIQVRGGQWSTVLIGVRPKDAPSMPPSLPSDGDEPLPGGGGATTPGGSPSSSAAPGGAAAGGAAPGGAAAGGAPGTDSEPSALAKTGGRIAPVIGVGAMVLVGGAAAFVVARRRRSRFVFPD